MRKAGRGGEGDEKGKNEEEEVKEEEENDEEADDEGLRRKLQGGRGVVARLRDKLFLVYNFQIRFQNYGFCIV